MIKIDNVVYYNDIESYRIKNAENGRGWGDLAINIENFGFKEQNPDEFLKDITQKNGELTSVGFMETGYLQWESYETFLPKLFPKNFIAINKDGPQVYLSPSGKVHVLSYTNIGWYGGKTIQTFASQAKYVTSVLGPYQKELLH